MRAEELVEVLERRPFVPVRLHLDDGRQQEIHHPEMAIVSQAWVAIGIISDDSSTVADRITHCAIDHIVEVELLPSSSP